MVGPPPSFISQKHFRFAREMLRRCLCQIILADPVEQRLANANLYRALIFVRSSAGPHASLRRAQPLRRHRLPHNPQSLRYPLGIGAGPILIAGCGGKLSASFSKKACRSGYNSVTFFLNQFLLRKDLRGKFQLSRLRNIAQFLRLLVRLQQRAFSSLNHKQ